MAAGRGRRGAARFNQISSQALVISRHRVQRLEEARIEHLVAMVAVEALAERLLAGLRA